MYSRPIKSKFNRLIVDLTVYLIRYLSLSEPVISFFHPVPIKINYFKLMNLKCLDCTYVSVRLIMYLCVLRIAGPALLLQWFFFLLGPVEVLCFIFPPSHHPSANIPQINPIYCAHDNSRRHLYTSSL